MMFVAFESRDFFNVLFFNLRVREMQQIRLNFSLNKIS